LNRIRAWVRQGRTDAWIAHQLEVTVQQIQVFKREHDLDEGSQTNGENAAADFDDEIDLRAEDDALIAAELEAAEARQEEEGSDSDSGSDAESDSDPDSDSDDEDRPSRRRRGRRGGGRRRARGKSGTLEATFDHGEEGYGLWLDPAVQDDPVYAEHWAGHRPVTVTVEDEQIVIRRAGAGDGDDDAGADDDGE